jgi:hypothetical protein
MSEGIVRGGLSRVGDANVGGWDGYYAEVAIEEGVTKTLDYDEWVANVDPPVGRRERLDVVFADRPPGATEAFEAADSEAEVESFATPKLSLRATR